MEFKIGDKVTAEHKDFKGRIGKIVVIDENGILVHWGDGFDGHHGGNFWYHEEELELHSQLPANEELIYTLSSALIGLRLAEEMVESPWLKVGFLSLQHNIEKVLEKL